MARDTLYQYATATVQQYNSITSIQEILFALFFLRTGMCTARLMVLLTITGFGPSFFHT